MNASRTLRDLLAAPGPVVAPGVYDGLTAKLVEQAGFRAAYMTGAGTSLAYGYPDYGLLTATEMAANAGRIADAISLPLIADADTGYGNELNVTRTVREYEKLGVAALHIEDQVTPKRCGHTEGKELVSIDDFVSKIRAAVAARRGRDFVIIARTDARGVTGLENAVARANSALAAGADMAFVEAPTTIDEVKAVPRLVRGPCIMNIVPGGKTPPMTTGEAGEYGYKLVILPGAALKAVIEATDNALKRLRDTGTLAAADDEGHLARTFARLGAGEWDALRRGGAV